MKISKFIEELERELVKTRRDVEDIQRLQLLKEKSKAYEGEDKMVKLSHIAESLRNEPEERKIMSGWSKLDAIIGGFREEQVIVVSALTKSGKTAFCVDLTSRMASENPAWFPFEESARELVRKFIERGENPPHALTPLVMKGNTIEWIEKRIIESIAKFDTKVVFIDQLDFIVPMGGDNHALRVGQAMRDLKEIAKKWGVTIFLICHLSKAKMDMQPTLEDLKGSSSIGQEADTVILLWRESKREHGQMVVTDNLNVSVQANRRMGRTGNVKMHYSGGRFTEKEWEDGHDEERRADQKFMEFGL